MVHGSVDVILLGKARGCVVEKKIALRRITLRRELSKMIFLLTGVWLVYNSFMLVFSN
jgi:hypothetical protein